METFSQYTSGFNKVFYKNVKNIYKYEGLIPPVGVLNLLNYWYLEHKVVIIIKITLLLSMLNFLEFFECTI